FVESSFFATAPRTCSASPAKNDLLAAGGPSGFLRRRAYLSLRRGISFFPTEEQSGTAPHGTCTVPGGTDREAPPHRSHLHPAADRADREPAGDAGRRRKPRPPEDGPGQHQVPLLRRRRREGQPGRRPGEPRPAPVLHRRAGGEGGGVRRLPGAVAER